MLTSNTYCVTDWKTYYLLETNDHHQAVIQAYSDKFLQISDCDLTDDTVTHAMCCKYEGEVSGILERCSSDTDRVLIMNSRPETKHYQLR